MFFTFARQLLATYLLPGFAGLAVLAGVALAAKGEAGSRPRFSVLLRWQLVVSALAAGGLAVYAARRGGQGLAVLAVALGVLLCFRPSCWPLRGVPALVCVQAVGVAALVFLTVAVARPALDDSLSAKTILQRVAHDPRLEGRPLVFPSSEEHSADFYARLYLGTGDRAPSRHRQGPAGGEAPARLERPAVRERGRLAASRCGPQESRRDRRPDTQLGGVRATSPPLAHRGVGRGSGQRLAVTEDMEAPRAFSGASRFRTKLQDILSSNPILALGGSSTARTERCLPTRSATRGSHSRDASVLL